MPTARQRYPTMTTNYLTKILNARVYDVAIESPLEFAPSLSARLENQIYFKREDMQSVFSFKLRGAYNKMAHLTPAQLKRGVICASAGNHAQGVALGAKRMGCRAVIVMPTTTPQMKIDAVKARGGEVVLFGDSYSDAAKHAVELEKKLKLTFVHPFDDPDVIAGQGTIAMEILHQHAGPIHAIFVAIGGGGLISGVAAYVKAVRPEIKVIGVQTVDSDAMARSVKSGRRVTLPDVGLFSDGTAVKLVGEETFRLTKQYVDDILIVDTDEVCAAIKDVFQDTRSILEPAGALAVAGAKKYLEQAKAAKKPIKGETLITIACGANMNFDRLRLVAERADVGEAREAVLAVTIPEERGSFKRFCEQVGPRNVTEFIYRISEEKQAHVFVGVQIAAREDSARLVKNFEKHGFKALDLTHDELAKLHIRHLVGGKSTLAQNELLYRFEFPERPGALMRFLNSMAPNWNISLFHYRSQGGDVGRILVGLQVPKKEMKAFREFLAGLGYPHIDESENPAYKLFLG
ncbi:MAG: threonine ammonia-lyase, biosynthetic [Proteobacteria bacterium]|nr:threonine ammonia-lyase, biosynthetic [Pseudomonadota bacterium]